MSRSALPLRFAKCCSASSVCSTDVDVLQRAPDFSRDRVGHLSAHEVQALHETEAGLQRVREHVSASGSCASSLLRCACRCAMPTHIAGSMKPTTAPTSDEQDSRTAAERAGRRSGAEHYAEEQPQRDVLGDRELACPPVRGLCAVLPSRILPLTKAPMIGMLLRCVLRRPSTSAAVATSCRWIRRMTRPRRRSRLARGLAVACRMPISPSDDRAQDAKSAASSAIMIHQAATCPRKMFGARLMPRALELLGEARPDAGRPERAQDAAVGVHAGLLEAEDVLHRHDLAFHAGDLADGVDLAGAVREAAIWMTTWMADASARESPAPAARSPPSGPCSRCGRGRRAACWRAPCPASLRDRCSSPASCRTLRSRGPHRR